MNEKTSAFEDMLETLNKEGYSVEFIPQKEQIEIFVYSLVGNFRQVEAHAKGVNRTDTMQEAYTQVPEAGAQCDSRMATQYEELHKVATAALEYIDAIPDNVVLPTMPGFDRDWADTTIEKGRPNKNLQLT